MKKPPIIIAERVAIPASLVPLKRMLKHYRRRLYREAGCARCPLLQSRHCADCEGCRNFEGELRFFRETDRKGVRYYEVPAGDLDLIESQLGVDLSRAIDRRVNPKFRFPLRWTGSLRHGQKVDGIITANQKKIVRQWKKKRRNGLIEAPPRTGKTVLGTHIIVTEGRKALIIAHQEELLKNFYKTFLRDTNLKALRKRTGKRIVDIVKKETDFKHLDVALVTYQKFIREGTGHKRILKYLKGRFGTLLVDEVHQAAAAAYSRFINELDVSLRIGLTATPKRKDKLHILVEKVIGPVQVVANSVALVPEMYVWETNIKPPYAKGYSMWPYAMKFLFNHPERNKMIVRQVFEDLRAGHKCIILPVDQIKHLTELVKMINHQARVNRGKRGERWPRELAVGLHGKTDRAGIFKAIEDGKHQVLVAIRSMVKQGIDLQAPTALYVVVPMSNPAMMYQLASRVCTPEMGKQQPIVRVMVDRLVQSSGCFRSVFRKEIMPKLRTQGDSPPRYKMPEDELKKAMAALQDTQYHKRTPLRRAVAVVHTSPKTRATAARTRAVAKRGPVKRLSRQEARW